MTSSEMHIDFRVKFNKVNSNKNKRFMPEEIDWIINDQIDKFVFTRASRPGNYKAEGFEETQKRLDDIRTVVKLATTDVATSVDDNILLLELHEFSGGKYINLPTTEPYPYLMLVSDSSNTQDDCNYNLQAPNRLFSSELIPVVLKDEFHTTNSESPVSELVGNKLRVFEDNFVILALNISYVYKYPRMVYNSVDCVLPSHTHREIVDMAVSKVNAMLKVGNYEQYINEISKNE